MTESKVVAVQVANRVITDAVLAVAGRMGDLYTVGAMEFVELVGIADVEINRAALRVGRSLLQKDLHLIELDPGKVRWLAPEKPQREAQLFGVEIHGGGNVGDGEAGVVLLAVNLRSGGRGCHGLKF